MKENKKGEKIRKEERKDSRKISKKRLSKLFYYVLFLVNYIHTKHSTQTDRETETSNKYVQINNIYISWTL